MTQDSVFHSGQQRGDARAYSAQEFHNVLTLTHFGKGGYVISSGSIDVLGVSHNAGRVLDIQDGSAAIVGVYYNNSAATTLTLEENNTLYTRIDRVVIRVDWTAHTARIVAKRGAASSFPVPPDLIQEAGNIYELPLALVFCPPSFAGFGDEYIIDERPFSDVITNAYYLGTKNIMPNSEFIASNQNAFFYGLPYWTNDGAGGFPATYQSPTYSEKFDVQSRGRSIRLSTQSTTAMGAYLWLNNSTTRRMTLSFPILVETGEVYFSIDGGATLTQRIPPTGAPIIVTIRASVGSAGGNQAIEPYFYSAATAIYKLGQITVTFGDVAAPFMPCHETVVHQTLDSIVLNTNSSDTVDYSMTRAWPGVRNFWVRMHDYDTASAGSDTVYGKLNESAVVGAGDNEYMRIEIGRHPNSIRRYAHGLMCPELEYSNFAVTNLNEIFWEQSITLQEATSSNCQVGVGGTEV